MGRADELRHPDRPRRQLDAPGQTLDILVSTTGLTTILSGLPLPGLDLTQQAILIRLSLGTPAQTITDTEVTASAASEFLTTIIRPENPLLDLSLGLLTASALTPNNPPSAACGTPGCKLRVTGFNIGVAAGLGILILILGRLLLILTTPRRPRT